MAPTATAVKEEVTHKPSIGSVTGSTVVATTAGIGTAAIGTKIAKDGIDFKGLFNKAKEHPEHVRLSLDLDEVTQGAKQVAENSTNGTVLNEATEKAKETAKGFKDKAGEVFDSLKNSASELKANFQSLPPAKKALVVIPAAIAFALAYMAAHAKLSEVQPTSKVENVSKEGKIKSKTNELEI